MLKSVVIGGLMLCVSAGTAWAGDLDKSIVTQGGASVTMGDVDAFMQRIPEERRAGFFANPTRVNQMLISILRNKQLAREAADMKLDQAPEVKAEVNFLTDDVLARARVRSFDDSLNVPSMAAAAKEEYAAHKSEYVIPPDVEVQHVLISFNGRSEADAKALAEKVRSEALANPKAFDDLVEKYSDDPSKTSNKGHIPEAASDKMVAAFAEAAGKLKKPGEISPIVQTKYGLHVLRLVTSVPGKPIPYDEVKGKLEAKLKENYVNEQRKNWMAKFDSGAPKVDPQVMELLHNRYAPNGMPSIEDAVKGKPSN
ncbi:MAG: peptidylprolyl isomerase [Rudaea sp.]|uniref:peptidylprolyl isomerase n=1 Tax=unclassified Rudaea TaxID=2627037 RepID=UPI0010F68FE5|nr:MULTISPECIES: peptidylprolyl isomerase [unclassified Rudaea]MBN8885872.1 peptidylprolyl isomerase [Rudaea sp.]MBR0345695.1 peptidylprolyl isomerase [Rudaea sp.]